MAHRVNCCKPSDLTPWHTTLGELKWQLDLMSLRQAAIRSPRRAGCSEYSVIAIQLTRQTWGIRAKQGLGLKVNAIHGSWTRPARTTTTAHSGTFISRLEKCLRNLGEPIKSHIPHSVPVLRRATPWRNCGRRPKVEAPSHKSPHTSFLQLARYVILQVSLVMGHPQARAPPSHRALRPWRSSPKNSQKEKAAFGRLMEGHADIDLRAPVLLLQQDSPAISSPRFLPLSCRISPNSSKARGRSFKARRGAAWR